MDKGSDVKAEEEVKEDGKEKIASGTRRDDGSISQQLRQREWNSSEQLWEVGR